jgi:flagellar basal-body rod modification protein FlgD
MNAYVTFRANGAGTLAPTPGERLKAAREVWSGAYPKAYRKSLEKAADGTETKSAAGATGATGAAGAAGATDQTLNKDTFLQLLVTQMQYQDPMEPMNNEDMLAQLAQFSSLEQMNNLNKSFESLADVLRQQSLMTASNLLGQEISATTSSGLKVDGPVDKVTVSGGTVYLNVGSQVVTIGDITQIGSPA